MISKRATKRLNEEPENGEISKRRRKTLSFTPFKQVGIPISWKFDLRKLREAVRTSVSHCQYVDPYKRERLGNAVPFTTLQTYFHRSRARMAKIMNDNDNALPEQIPIPIPLTLSSSDVNNALTEEKFPVEFKKSKRLDALLDVLMSRVVASDTCINGTLSPSDFAPRKLGSNKRKPKEVHRITPVTATKNESLVDFESPNRLTDQSETIQNDPAESNTMKSITAKYNKEEVMAIIRSAISNSSLDEKTKKLVEGVIDGILDKSLNIDDMCAFLTLGPAFANSSVYRVEQNLDIPDRMLHKNEVDFDEAAENHNHVPHLSGNYERLGKMGKCANEVHRFSHYPALQEEALHKAIAMVIRGEYSVSGAASIMELPTSTVHPYVRAALEIFLPQQTETLDRETAADQCIQRNGSVSEEVEIVISSLMKIPSYDPEAQKRFHDALSEVLTKDVPVEEVSSKYGIAVAAFQPYITKARVLLGQSPYPTSSNIEEISTELGAKLSNSSEEYVDEENNFNKMLTNTEFLLRNISTDDTVFTIAATVHPNIAEDFSKHENRYNAENRLTKTGESINDNSHTEHLLSGAISDLNRNSNEFDDAIHIQSDEAEIRSKCGKRIENMNSTSSEKIELSTKNIVALHSKTRSDGSDDEFDGFPRSIRGVTKLLSDTKLDKLSTKHYAGTPENLAIKIDKVLRQYRFRGDRKKMRNGILEVLYKSKTLSEACKGNSLAPTTLSTYVRLVKVLINAEKTGLNGKSAATSYSNKVTNVENGKDSSWSADSANNGYFEQLTKKVDRNLPMDSPSLAEEDTKTGAEPLVQNVDVMLLHTKPIMNNLESFYKVLIAYLIEQQYRRSEEAQEKMRTSLEYVLLDGLSVAEALRVHKSPTEHVLQVYLSRCREVNRCIKTEFSNFKSNVIRAIRRNLMNDKQDVGAVQMHNNTTRLAKNNIKRFNKRLQNKELMTTEPTVGTLKHLNLIFSEDFRRPLYDYLKKLSGVNFPIEDSLIVGLAKMIVNGFPISKQIFFADTIWDEWLSNYRKEYPEFG
uniref:Bm9662 n=1 Tax=Brugia malayi TaxID=6279 RepID=A0A0H5S755_BRUMA|nr:Bm9662 [Brugia malayi]